MTVSLLISTYNSPEALELCLQSVLQQTVLPDEILIADDGSTQPTTDVVAHFQQTCSIPVRHIWHEDRGFRLTVIRNKAIAQATMEYVIQIDGDIILNRHFIEDHKRFARRGSFVTGSRLNIQPELSAKLIAEHSINVSFRNKGVHNRLNGIRCRLFTLLLQGYRRNVPSYVRGCNMAFWRSDLIRINGYNEEMTGWGLEDWEIAYRLMHAGVLKRFIKNAGIAFHLYHPENSREKFSINHEIFQQSIDQKKIRCSKGIDQYL